MPKTTTTRIPRPWSTLMVGETFHVPRSEATLSSVRSMAYARGQDLGRRFSVTRESDGCRVTREPDRTPAQAVTAGNDQVSSKDR